MSEKRSFSPADLQKDLKNFLEEKYGNQVVFQEGEAAGMQEGPPVEEPAEQTIDFDLKPEELEAYLTNMWCSRPSQRSISHQDMHALQPHEARPRRPGIFAQNVGHIKNNILLIGPTGVGKTYLIKLIAQRIGVPFVKGDATKFSETGYVGRRCRRPDPRTRARSQWQH